MEKSVPLVFFFSLLRPQRKLALLFRLPLLPADRFPRRAQSFPLGGQRLLGFRADAGALQLLFDAALPPLGIVRGGRMRLCVHLGAEFQLIIVPEKKFPHFIVLRLPAEGDFADGKAPVLDPFQYADPERFFKINRQGYESGSDTTPLAFFRLGTGVT